MSTFIFILLVLIALTVVLALLAPKEYEIKRSIYINKPLDGVFTYLKSLKMQDDWSPWAEKDLNREKTFIGIDGEVGCVSAWKGNKGVGEGEQEITNIVENVSIETQLRFLKPFKSTSDAYLRVKKEGEGTQVIWGFRGKHKFPVSIMMLFMNMDKAIGKDFDYGLNKLKSILEK